MTIKEIIIDLEKSGYDISFYKRQDGGIRITRINGETFRGSKGNQRAREISGASLSDAQVRALGKLKTPKGKGSYNKRRKSKLDESTRQEILRIQRLYRKAGKQEGKPTIRNYRYVLKHHGKKEANRLLRQSERRILGLAYPENVDWLLTRLKMINKGKYKSDSLTRAIKRIKELKDTFKEAWLNEIYDLGVESDIAVAVASGLMSSEELGNKILAIIG